MAAVILARRRHKCNDRQLRERERENIQCPCQHTIWTVRYKNSRDISSIEQCHFWAATLAKCWFGASHKKQPCHISYGKTPCTFRMIFFVELFLFCWCFIMSLRAERLVLRHCGESGYPLMHQQWQQLNCCKHVVKDVKSSHEMLFCIWKTFCWGSVVALSCVWWWVENVSEW